MTMVYTMWSSIVSHQGLNAFSAAERDIPPNRAEPRNAITTIQGTDGVGPNKEAENMCKTEDNEC